jgi:hypothetical protein
MGTMVAFTEQIERPALIDDGYTYGESTRVALTNNGRHRFNLARQLVPSQADLVEQFYRNTQFGQSFYFYNLRETVPLGSWDASGQNPVGRYTVTWDGPMLRTTVLGGRGVILEFALREVEG